MDESVFGSPEAAGEPTTSRGVYVGRENELAAGVEVLDEALAGHGRLLLLPGEPGIGKSRLADELATRARQRGARVLWGRCWEAGGAPAYWPWVQSIRSYLRAHDAGTLREQMGTGAAELAQMLPELQELVPDLPPPPSGEPDSLRFRLFESTAVFLRTASHAQPILLVLDDLHASDEPSLLLLRFLAAELSDSRLLVVAAYRDTELGAQHALTAALPELLRQPATRLLSLSRLSKPAVDRYVALLTGVRPHEALVEAVHEETEGNPLFVAELARLLATEGRLDDPARPVPWRLAIPHGVRGVIGRRLRHLSQECREVLALASVLGREFGIEVLERLSGRAAEELLELLDEAVAAGTIVDAPGALGRLRFAHLLIRDTLYDDLPATRRMLLHRQAGEALEGLHADRPGPHLAQLAHHFLEAAPSGAVDKAVEYARLAAERALAMLAYEEAVRLFAMALDALDLKGSKEETVRCDLLLALGDAQARAGEAPSAKQTFRAAAETAERLGRAEALATAALGYGGRFVWEVGRGDPHLVPLLEGALQALGDRDSIQKAKVMARLAGGPLRDDPVRERRATLSQEAVEMARRLGDPATLAYVLDGRYAAVWWPENVEERLAIATELIRAAQQAADGERGLQGHHYRCLARLEVADMAGVHTDLDAQARLARELKQPAQRWYLAATRATLATYEGRLIEAEELIPEALALGERALGPMAAAYDAILLYLLRRLQGRLAEVEETVRARAEEFLTYPVLGCILAHVYVELGREEQGREALVRFAEGGFAVLPRNDEWLFGVGLLAEVAGHLGDVTQATRLYDLLSPYAARNAVSTPDGCTGSVSRNLGILAATVSRWEEAIGHYEDALERNERAGALPWVAETCHAFAGTLLARDGPGDRERAAELHARARETSTKLGMATPAGPFASDLEPSGAIPRGRTAAPARPAAAGRPSVFRRDGDCWSIAFERDAFRLKDTKGLRYLHELLSNPGREIHALDLTVAGEGIRRGHPAHRGRELDEAGLAFTGAGDAGEILDATARAAYEQRLEELREEIEEAEAWNDPERAARAREEMEIVTSELAGAVGLGGRSRRAGSPAERARQSVTKATKLAIERIAAQSPPLGRHLEATVRTGGFCRYEPDPRAPVDWHT